MYNYKKLDSYALSGDDIKKILGRDVKIIKYPDFGSVDSIFDAFINNECVIFFETVSQMVGHWECMFYNPNIKTIQFFDSYGLPPDNAEKFLRQNTRITLKENTPYLKKLLNKAQDSGYNCIYSNFKYQEMIGDIETCGKWSSIRLKNKNMNDDEFYNYITGIKTQNNLPTYDDTISFIVYKIIGK
jgi:YesN/AraC family two-component response regulator